jgi:hypothetical protein
MNNDVIIIEAQSSIITVEQQGRVIELNAGIEVVEVVSTGQVTINTSGSAGQTHTQTAPASSWNITHSFGRLPSVSVYLNTGEEVDTDVNATSTSVTITFPTATSGSAILT